MLSEKERLIHALSGVRCDRPPVIAPGGMMSFLTTDLLEANGIDGARVVSEAQTMAYAAEIVRDASGLESLGVPFCLTVEAEALGATVSIGTTTVEPMLVECAVADVRGISALSVPEPDRNGRMAEVLEAIHLLKERNQDVATIGNLSGPVTLATSIIPYEDFFRLLIKNKAAAKAVIDVAVETIIWFGTAMVRSGADVIAVSDPTAAGEIIGPRVFETYFVPEYQRIFSTLAASGAKTILHICGNVRNVLPCIASCGADAFSMDSMMSVKRTRAELTTMPIMGNVSTLLLVKGHQKGIERAVRTIIAEGADIVAPSCGIDRGTPTENLRAMCQTVKSWSS